MKLFDMTNWRTMARHRDEWKVLIEAVMIQTTAKQPQEGEEEEEEEEIEENIHEKTLN